MFIRLLVLIFPLVFFIAFQQLRFPINLLASVFYIASCLYFCLIKEERLPNFLKKYKNDFIKGNVISFCFIIIIATFPIGGYLSIPLMLPHSQEKAEAVIVLGSGTTRGGDPNYSTYLRIIHAARLIKSGQAKHLYISTGYSEINEFMEYYAVASLSEMLDIPKERITIFKSEEIKTTATEANYIKKEMDKKGIKKILLTTSKAHIYRSYLTFKKLGFEVLPAPSHTVDTVIYADDNIIMFRAAMHEWIGLAWYFLMGRI